MNQKKWYDASFANAEKEIMVSAFMIRKLFESNKIDQRLASKEIDSIYYESNGERINWMKNIFPDRYFNLEKPKSRKIKLKDVCNQIIHSYIFSLLRNETNKLNSFWFVSDFDKFKHLIELELRNYIDLVKLIGNYWPQSEHYIFDFKTNDYKVFHDLNQNKLNEEQIEKILTDIKE